MKNQTNIGQGNMKATARNLMALIQLSVVALLFVGPAFSCIFPPGSGAWIASVALGSLGTSLGMMIAVQGRQVSLPRVERLPAPSSVPARASTGQGLFAFNTRSA